MPPKHAPRPSDITLVRLGDKDPDPDVASAERSFSKLKMIKNYIRSTMSQEILSGLSILSIENERARGLNISTIVKTFAEKNARRRDRFL